MELHKSEANIQDKIDIKNNKMKLLNLICATMIHEPRYYSSVDQTKEVITQMVNTVAEQDPEFIFKLALYVRDDLNIRSTANYLLVLAANNKKCHPFFKKYFSAIIRLPTDMLEVVSMFLELPDKYLQGKGLPTPLRKAVEMKFPSFDVYQLAKYNKERSLKRKAKKALSKAKNPQEKPPKRQRLMQDQSAPASEKPTLLTMKQLIRKVHISQPAENVMCIVGKKYPESQEAFVHTGLPGSWDSRKSGKRMKLPTPETWEVLLSAKGNKHSTWEELIDHKKLPFMAMLRNLRNLIITGISPKHHQAVLSRLTDEKSVISSRQLPWRFLSAYEAIDIDLEKLMNDVLDNDGAEEKVVQVEVKGKKGREMGRTRQIRKKAIIPVHMPDLPLIQQYRQAIDTAIRISTMHNLKPIEGKTVVFCDVSGSMDCKCSTKGNMGGSIQKVKDVAILLGLMIQDSCEECDFRVFSSPGRDSNGKCDIAVPLEANTILNNVKRIEEYATRLGGGTDFPYDYLEGLIKRKEKIDNFIILSDMMIAPGYNEMELRNQSVSHILKSYRAKVNPNLLFVAVDLFGNGASIVDVNADNPLEILITGFSDNILRFIAEKGNHKQLEYVENIDKTKFQRKKAKNGNNSNNSNNSSEAALPDANSEE